MILWYIERSGPGFNIQIIFPGMRVTPIRIGWFLVLSSANITEQRHFPIEICQHILQHFAAAFIGIQFTKLSKSNKAIPSITGCCCCDNKFSETFQWATFWEAFIVTILDVFIVTRFNNWYTKQYAVPIFACIPNMLIVLSSYDRKHAIDRFIE